MNGRVALLLGDNVGESVCDLGLGQNFLDIAPEA